MKIWKHPSITLVGMNKKGRASKQVLDEVQLRDRGYVIVETIDNPFDMTCEGKTRYCSVTKESWPDDELSPYLVWMEQLGELGGTGAGPDHIGRENSRISLIDFFHFIGPKKCRAISTLIGQIDERDGIVFDEDHQEIYQYLAWTGQRYYTPREAVLIDLKNKDRNREFEPALAWLTTLDNEKTFQEIQETYQIISDVIHTQEQLNKIKKQFPQAIRANRNLWKEIEKAAFHCPRKRWRSLVESFLKSHSNK